MAQKPTILIVDDERNTREGLQRLLAPEYTVLLAENGLRGLEILEQNRVDVVLTDLRMPGMDGMAFIKRASARENAPLIIMLTAYGSVATAVEAMRVGAYDYITKPVNIDNLEMMVERGLESRRLHSENDDLRRQLDEKYGLDEIIGRSPAMMAVLDTVRQIAPARSTVLISGESGTGKELIARALHNLSPRAQQPFVVVHCAALNANLLESELFGHERGAFTGARERQAGRFERADGGTLFLDEIGEIDASTQVKLLRVLESRSFERVGGSQPVDVDVRLLVATNRDLRTMVEEGTFREDLFFRLNVVEVRMPPLRERMEDLELLLDHFRDTFAQENARDVRGFTPEAMRLLGAYSWPGNVRELRNCVERMVVMSRGSMLSVGDVPLEVRAAVGESFAAAEEGEAAAVETARRTLNLDRNERELIKRALEKCGGNRTQAARELGISRRTLHRKLHTYGLGKLEGF